MYDLNIWDTRPLWDSTLQKYCKIYILHDADDAYSTSLWHIALMVISRPLKSALRI